MSFCQNCGTKLEHGEAFCPNCGSKVSDQGHASPAHQTQPAYSSFAAGEPKVTGGLKVWLWILIVCGIISIIYNLGMAFTTSVYKVELVLDAIILAVDLYGEFLMLKAHKKGFYIIVVCTCIGVVFGALSTVSTLGWAFSLTLSLGGALLSVGVLWLFTRKQWPNFR